MTEMLELPIAQKYARRVTVIPGKKFWDDEALLMVARALINLCSKNRFVKNQMWTPEDQADWVTTEIANTWDDWRGIPAMKDLFAEKFGGKVVPLEQQVLPSLGEKPQIECLLCNDFGTRPDPKGRSEYCSCKQGKLLKYEIEQKWKVEMGGVKTLNPVNKVQ